MVDRMATSVKITIGGVEMIARCQGGSVLIQAAAKINLFLEVLARRSDGFHEIETLIAPITLFDSLRFGIRSHPRI